MSMLQWEKMEKMLQFEEKLKSMNSVDTKSMDIMDSLTDEEKIQAVCLLLQKRCEYNRSEVDQRNLCVFSQHVLRIMGCAKHLEDFLIEMVAEYMEHIFIDSENTQTEGRTQDVIIELSNFACLFGKDVHSPMYQKIKRKIDSMVGARSGSLPLF